MFLAAGSLFYYKRFSQTFVFSSKFEFVFLNFQLLFSLKRLQTRNCCTLKTKPKIENEFHNLKIAVFFEWVTADLRI